MIHMRPSICGPELLQVPWDARSAQRYTLESMVTASHYVPALLESFLSSKI
jgi:hypothetical protein